jgi:AraC family transcriptional regulator, transcriptional activator of pobA
MSHIPVYGISEFYLPKNETSFYVNRLSDHLLSHQFVNKPHSHSTYIAVLFTKGTGIHYIDFQTYPVQPWSVFLLSPGQVHSWDLSDDTDGFVFFHTRSFYDDASYTHKVNDYPFFFLSQNYPMVNVPEHAHSTIENLFLQIFVEANSNFLYKQLKIHTMVTTIYIELARLYQNKEIHFESENHLRVRMLLRLIDTFFVTHKLPNQYAEMMHMSTRHLSRICNEILDKNTGELIQERVVLEAKRLLIYSKSTVSDVAFSLGFEDVSYFNRFFKSQSGITPKEFRVKNYH